MADHIIEVRVDDKIATVVGDPLYVCGNSDYVVKFAFDAEWADHAMKTARFIKSNKEYIDVVFNGNECQMPIIADTPYVRIGVFAGNLCTTTAAIVNAQRSILCGSGVPAEPDPDVYAQILERIDNLNIPDPDEYSKVISEQIDALNIPDLTKRVDALQSNAVIAQHVRGDMLHIEDAASWPMEKLVTSIEPKQEESGDPSPDNVRPISGWTEAALNRTGKNLFDYNARIIGYELFRSNGGIGMAEAWYVSDYISVKPGSAIVLSGLSSNVATYYDKDKKYISYTQTKKIVVPENAYYIRVNSLIEGYTTPQVEYGETATAYEPYRGAQYTAQFDQTVYGGEFDWKTGVLTVTKTQEGDLVTPEKIQLSPQQMPEMLKGVNNVWCDTGETEMVYIADNQLYIDQKIGESAAALNAIMEGINNV